MAATLTITNAGSNPTPIEPTGAQFVSEILKVVGSSSAAADTGTFTTTIGRVSGVKGGAFTASQSGTTLTLTTIYALASNTVFVEAFGSKNA